MANSVNPRSNTGQAGSWHPAAAGIPQAAASTAMPGMGPSFSGFTVADSSSVAAPNLAQPGSPAQNTSSIQSAFESYSNASNSPTGGDGAQFLKAVQNAQQSSNAVGSNVYAESHYDTSNPDNLFHPQNAKYLQAGQDGALERMLSGEKWIRTSLAGHPGGGDVEQHLSLNAEPSADLLKKLDGMLLKYQGIIGTYSHLGSLNDWRTAPDPVVIAVRDAEQFEETGAFAELKNVMAGHERSFSEALMKKYAETNSPLPDTDARLPGTKEGFGIARQQAPSEAGILGLLERSRVLHPDLADTLAETILLQLEHDELSPSRFAAIEQTITHLESHGGAASRAGQPAEPQPLAPFDINPEAKHDMLKLLLSVDAGAAGGQLCADDVATILRQILTLHDPNAQLDLRDLGGLGSWRMRDSPKKTRIHRCRRCGRYTWDVDQFCWRQTCRRPAGTAVRVWLDAALREANRAGPAAGTAVDSDDLVFI